MPRPGHGRPITDQEIEAARDHVARAAAEATLAFACTPPVRSHHYDLLFPTLQEQPGNLLPRDRRTNEQLKALGVAMEDDDRPGEDSPIPAAYTYLGQFIDHDITLESGSGQIGDLLRADMVPMDLAQIRGALRNRRSATLDLDSVYSLPAPRVGDRLKLGRVTDLGDRPPPRARPRGKTDDNDLPRRGPSQVEDLDRTALIGDFRNDENTILSQLHVAFLKAHNALVGQGLSFTAARRELRRHYQHIVLHDFLRKIADTAIVDDVLENGNRWFDPSGDGFFMPLEFSVAAYRFGHSMVRNTYRFNSNFPDATLADLFTFSALSGELAGAPTLPENWIIEWENLVGDRATRARRIDTNLAASGNRALFDLRGPDGEPEPLPEARRLAVRNLLRGYRLRLPTGQAVADLLDVKKLSDSEIIAAAGSPQQIRALQAGKFQHHTPLWYYVLAEARHFHGGERLGPVGSTIVAEVLIGLAHRSEDSILALPHWRPTLPSVRAGTFELADLLRLADVLPGRQAPRTYTVVEGDTLGKIAQARLGQGERWPEIYLLNRAQIRNPSKIFPGQVFVLPPREPTGPTPRLYVVKKDDSLFKIAQAHLGKGERWPEIHALNRDIIKNPRRIIPGQILALPAR